MVASPTTPDIVIIKESTILGLLKTMKTSKEDFKKQLLEQREGTSGMSLNLKSQMESSKNIKIIYKKNHDEITRVNESRFMSKGIEGRKKGENDIVFKRRYNRK